MSMSFRSFRCVALSMLLICVSTGCGGSSDPGESRWRLVQSAFAGEDYARAADHLKKLEEIDAWRERAVGWRVVILGGLTHAYLELNEACEAGLDERAVTRRAADRALLNALDQYRSDARRQAFALAEAVREFDELTGDVETVSLDFTLPSGDGSPSPIVARISGGMMPTGTGLKGSEVQTIRRGILLQSARAVGAGDNVRTAQKMFEFAPVSVPKAVFLLGIGQTLHEAADLFSVRRLRDHTKQELFFELAEKCVRPGLESKNLGLQKEAQEILAAIETSRAAMEDRGTAKGR